ncbi:hypothetical protein NW759_003741 [Fusarium solani]|nr:hypothetical protein NW759_003741 [Fusarium solani]
MTPCQKLSEIADVFYIISRSHHDGYPLRHLYNFAFSHLSVYAEFAADYDISGPFWTKST